jgi:HEAT repeat protein
VRAALARLVDADPALAADFATVLRRIGDESAGAVALASLTDERYTRRLAAANALGVLRDPCSVDALIGALNDEIAAVRRAAVAALGRVGLSDATAMRCTRLVSDPDPYVRIAAVRALIRGPAAARKRLATLVDDRERLVRMELAQHTASLPDEAAAVLLADPDLRVREAAAQSAGTSQVEVLSQMLVGDPGGEVRRAAAQTLGALGGARAEQVLIHGIEDQDAVVRAGVLRALLHVLTRRKVIAVLRRELASRRPERRRASLYALARLDAIEVAEAAAGVAYDPDPDVRLALIHTADVLLRNPRAVVRQLAADPDPVVRNSAEVWLLRGRSERT